MTRIRIVKCPPGERRGMVARALSVLLDGKRHFVFAAEACEERP
jgi:hypothetical protein